MKHHFFLTSRFNCLKFLAVSLRPPSGMGTNRLISNSTKKLHTEFEFIARLKKSTTEIQYERAVKQKRIKTSVEVEPEKM